MWILKILVFNLAIVFITELPLSLAFGARTGRKLITAALVNVITNPAVVLSGMFITLFLRKWLYGGVFVLELIVVLAEGFMFSKFKTFDRKNPYFISLVLNLVSFAAGEILNIIL